MKRESKKGLSVALVAASAVLVAVSALPAAAQGMRPGLWEHSSKVLNPEYQAQMAQAEAAMASMPPEQRKMVEQMMASQGAGMRPGGGGMTQKICVTKEQAARNEVGQTDPNCTQEHTRNGNRVRFKVNCTGARPMTGEGEYTFQGDTAYSGRMKMSAGGPNGGPMEMEQSGRWLSADCGDVKPRR